MSRAVAIAIGIMGALLVVTLLIAGVLETRSGASEPVSLDPAASAPARSLEAEMVRPSEIVGVGHSGEAEHSSASNRLPVVEFEVAMAMKYGAVDREERERLRRVLRDEMARLAKLKIAEKKSRGEFELVPVIEGQEADLAQHSGVTDRVIAGDARLMPKTKQWQITHVHPGDDPQIDALLEEIEWLAANVPP